MSNPEDSRVRILNDVKDHPILVEITAEGFVHTETYGVRGQIWYLTHDDGRYRFYNVETDSLSSSKPLSIEYVPKQKNALRMAENASEDHHISDLDYDPTLFVGEVRE